MPPVRLVRAHTSVGAGPSPGYQVDEDMAFEDLLYLGSRVRAEPVDLHPRTLVTHRQRTTDDR